ARVEHGVLARGRRVQLAAHLVEDLGDLDGVVAAAALEEEVLDEVRDTGALVALVPRARADPEADGDGAHARDALADHALAPLELGYLEPLHRSSLTFTRCAACSSPEARATSARSSSGSR